MDRIGVLVQINFFAKCFVTVVTLEVVIPKLDRIGVLVQIILSVIGHLTTVSSYGRTKTAKGGQTFLEWSDKTVLWANIDKFTSVVFSVGFSSSLVIFWFWNNPKKRQH
jgi:hypothetical protein